MTLIPYDWGGTFATAPGTSENISFFTNGRDVLIPADMAIDGLVTSFGEVSSNPVSDYVISLQADTVEFGTITISSAGVFTFATTGNVEQLILKGAAIDFVSPAVAVAGIAGLRFVLGVEQPADTIFSQQAPDKVITGTLASLATGANRFSHGMGTRPARAELYVVCTTAEHGYSIGDRVLAANDTTYGIQVGKSYSDVIVTADVAGVAVMSRTAGAYALLTAANWDYSVNVWASYGVDATSLNKPDQTVVVLGSDITSGNNVTAHGMAAVPDRMRISYECIVAENGYEVGDVIEPAYFYTNPNEFNMCVNADATNIGMIRGTISAPYYIRGSDGQNAAGVATSWNYILEAWWDAPTPDYTVTTAASALTLSSENLFAHGLSSAPVSLRYYYVCTTADGTWAIGDTAYPAGPTSSGAQRGATLSSDDTNVMLSVGSSLYVFDQSTGDAHTIDVNDWDVVVEADLSEVPSGGGGATTLLDLTDTPSSYVGEASKVLAVNVGETGTEWVVQSGGGGGGGIQGMTENILTRVFDKTSYQNISGHAILLNINVLGNNSNALSVFSIDRSPDNSVWSAIAEDNTIQNHNQAALSALIPDGYYYRAGLTSGANTADVVTGWGEQIQGEDGVLPAGAIQWRINISNNNGDANYSAIQEVEFLDGVGGAVITATVDGDPLASSNAVSQEAFRAFNGNTANATEAWVSASGQEEPSWLSFLFVTAVDVKEVKIMAQRGLLTRAPMDFTIEKTTNYGTTWVVVDTVVGATWTDGVYNTYTL
jgi:hypothetical protein